MSIYTRKGDKGQTALANGTIVSKANPRVDAYGTIDELNSEIGVALSHFKRGRSVRIQKELINIQNDLLEIGSVLANPENILAADLKKRVSEFEKLIDQLADNLPKLNTFILPGGSPVGSQLHLVRAVARRAERKVVNLIQKQTIDPEIAIYLNRLSDLLFIMARHVNQDAGEKELIWKKNKL